MPHDGKNQMSVADMHRRTSLLAEAAGSSGDDFLQYLYGLALAHLEEKGAKQPGKMRRPPPTIPQ